MKKGCKIILFIILSVFVCISGLIISFYIITSGVNLNDKKLIKIDKGVIFYDLNNKIIEENYDGISITKIEDINEHTVNAFISIEDKRFYSHNGVDNKGVIRAILNNFKSFSFKEGASTISQQLIKNTHLTNEKTLKRKLIEIRLAKKLEKRYNKKEILEMYLNTIYFGENCYGITKASKVYFGKNVTDLTINESAALAGIIKAPSTYSPFINKQKCEERKDIVLKEMFNQGYISSEEFNKNYKKPIEIENPEINGYGFNYLLKKESEKYSELAAFTGRKIKIYSTFDNTMQQNLIDSLFNDDCSCNKSGIILSKDNKILAYFSTCGDVKRNLGSTIKPLLVYAPALEENYICPETPILDEKTDFNGYKPSNYNNIYYGYVPAREIISKSLNVSAVKILNGLGIEKAKKYLSKTDIELTENDNSLCIALGSTEKGATLKEIVSAYNIFSNYGEYQKPTCIRKITDENDRIIFENKENKERVFSESTSYLVSCALNDCAKNGTAKRLSNLSIPLCAKTGTVGNKNGNSDAYSISYNPEYAIGVWYGNIDDLLSNTISGGTLPTMSLKSIWTNIYNDKTAPDFFKSKDVTEIKLDKNEYTENHKLVIADINSPDRFIIKGLFKNNNLPKETSTSFTNPKIANIKSTVNENVFNIQLSLPKLVSCKIYRYENGIKKLVYDSVNEYKVNYSERITNDSEYEYSIIPYYNDGEKTYYGNEVFLDKIKLNYDELNDFKMWWED